MNLLLRCVRRKQNKARESLSSRVSTLTRDIDIAILSVCPSVCLSVRHVRVLYQNGLTRGRNFFTRRRSVILLL